MHNMIPSHGLHDGGARDPFPVVRIICIGRNYADHAREMGHDPDREPPFFFFKPLTALNQSGQLRLPSYSNNVHYELELVLALTAGGQHLSAQQAAECIGGYALGLDMTCRDSQQQAKAKGRPWELAKGFDDSAPISAISRGTHHDLTQIGVMHLHLNGLEVQRGHWQQMIWSPVELIQQLSQYLLLRPGDLVFTGTPAGVGPVQPGDQLEGQIEGLDEHLQLSILS